MKVNGIDTWEKYDALEWSVTPGHATINNESEWPAGWSLPQIQSSTYGLKTIKVKVRVKGHDRMQILGRVSGLLSMFRRDVMLELDNLPTHYFFGALKSVDHPETVMRRYHMVTLEFIGYECGKDIVKEFDNQKEFTIMNKGTQVSPAVITITPTADMISLVVTGIVRDKYTDEDIPVVIHNLKAGKSVVLNGLNGLILQDGENIMDQVDIYDRPSLLPGENTITVDSETVKVNIKIRPIYI